VSLYRRRVKKLKKRRRLIQSNLKVIEETKASADIAEARDKGDLSENANTTLPKLKVIGIEDKKMEEV
jgi:transcription elongation GreA/GreB family factor